VRQNQQRKALVRSICKSWIFSVALISALAGFWVRAADAESPSIAAASTTTAPTLHAVPFDLNEVKLLDSPFKAAQERDKAYLLSLDADRLLHMFRVTAGLASNAKPYGGWEAPDIEVRGHTMGHYLSACALMYRNTGDATLKARTDYLVAELAKCQDALPKQGFNPGYLSAFPESFIDRVEQQKNVWAPWYVIHKIMAGLLDVYEQTGNRQALAVDTKMADWVKFRVDRLTVEQMQGSLGNEQGGMNEVLANLSAVTGSPEYLRLATAFNHRAVLDPLARGQDRLDGLHANTQVPKIIGAAREFELTGDEEYRTIAKTFWNSVALKRSYVFGGHSDGEAFFPVADFSKHLTWATAETCNVYNMLKLTRHLFEWEPSVVTMDFYERALYNQILASQEPDKGMVTYFLSAQPGHFKTYLTGEESFRCCSGTGMENHAKYADTIYFHSPANDELFVNLFIPSQLTWSDKKISIRQETKFPAEDSTRLIFACAQPTVLAVKVRYPLWARSGIHLTLNGQKIDAVGAAGAYINIRREWRDGDVLGISLPMTLHIEPLPNATQVAILYGPIVLAGELGRKGMETISDVAKDQGELSTLADPAVPSLATSDSTEILSHIRSVPDQPLTFVTNGMIPPQNITLIPLFRLNHQRYTVYWNTPETKTN
jgi:uncharacterized protein